MKRILSKEGLSKPTTRKELILVLSCIIVIIIISLRMKPAATVSYKDHGIFVTLVDENADGVVDKKLSRLPDGHNVMSEPTYDDQSYYASQEMTAIR